MSRRHFLLTCAALVGLGPRAAAHHPFSVYELEKEVIVSGEVVGATFAEPHCFLRVREPQGRHAVWVAEMKGVGALRAQGFTAQTLRSGDLVTLKGHPGRVVAERRLWLTSLVRARDGWSWSAS